MRGERLPQGRSLKQGEIGALFAGLDGDDAGDARDGALLALLFGCGLRRAEAAAITMDDVDADGTSIRIRDKGNRERTAHLPSGGRPPPSPTGWSTAAKEQARSCSR